MFEREAEEWYVILNMNCKYEICRRCPKSGLFKGSLKECDAWIKQKQKDEIKDKISMALKDPILQQGFEIICKENTELKGKAVKWYKVADGDLPNNYRYVWTNVGAGYYDDGWWDDFGRLQGVIAWCEPKFEE